MVSITLHGPLREAFPTPIPPLAVDSVGEALRALDCAFPGFLRTVRDMDCRWRVIRNGKDVNPATAPEELRQRGLRSVQIIPVPSGAGSGKGILTAIIGVVLIAASFYIGGAAGIAYLGATAASTISGIGISVGVGLALSGISSLLARTPKSTNDTKADNKASYIFQGAVNVASQGGPVPIGYGRMIIGSVVISAGISNRDVGAAVSTGTGTPGSEDPLPPTYNEP